MKICVGLKSNQELTKYIKAGATEFYCGVFDDDWVNRYGYLVGVNRRPFPSGNFSNFKQLKEAVEKAHYHGCKVFYTINEHQYSEQQIDLLSHHVESSIQCGVDAIIFSDPGLMYMFKDKCNVHVSTGGTIFNKSTIKFYRDELQAQRIIFPRELTINEIKSLTKDNQDTEFEVFMMNEGCINIDGFCNHLHGLIYCSEQGSSSEMINYSTACSLKYRITSINSKSSITKSKDVLEQRLHVAMRKRGDCGICAIYFFKDMGITSLKLVGRSTSEDKVEKDIKILKYAIEFANECNSFEEYYHNLNKLSCQRDNGLRLHECYYPDILKERCYE